MLSSSSLSSKERSMSSSALALACFLACLFASSILFHFLSLMLVTTLHCSETDARNSFK